MPQENRPFVINGVPVHERLLGRLPQLSKAVMAAILEQVPYYRQLPVEELDGDIRQVVRESLRVVAELLRDGRPPADADLSRLTDSAALRAEEGVPLEMVLSAYHVGLHEAWRLSTEDARPEDVEALRAVTDLVLGCLRTIVSAVTSAYNEELRARYGEEQSVRQTLLATLLGGEGGDSARTAAERVGVRLAPGYVVLALRIGAHRDETARGGVNRDGAARGGAAREEAVDGVRSAVAARRKLRRIQVELGRYTDELVLSQLDAEEGVVLLPSAEGVVGEGELAELVGRLTRAAGAEVTAAACHAAPEGVAGAAGLAREIIDVVRLTGRPPGLYQLADVLLDYQLSRSTAATDQLAALLAPLAGKEELLRTLSTHLANGLNRRVTAATLHIHPNTVDYRLRRITTLTGLDTGAADQLPVLAAALAARQVRKPR